MSLIDDVLADDMRYNAEADSVPGAEAISFYPRGSSTARSITAQVKRSRPEPSERSDKIRTPRVRIGVQNSATRGVSAAEDLKGGKFVIAKRKGHADDDEPLVILDDSLVSHDAGWLAFEFD